MKKYLYNIITQRPREPLGLLIKIILVILSLLYILAIKIRLKLYKMNIFKSERLNVPVISVGNITWGGTGKTPLVEAICSYFSLKGKKTAILTRGYGKDEDKALVQNLPKTIVLAGKDRLANAKTQEAKGEVDIFLLDDGFQHWRIKRDIDIVAVNATQPFGQKLLIPAGILREPLAHLNRADLIVLTRSDMVSSQRLDEIETDIIRLNPKAEIFRALQEPLFFEDSRKERVALEYLKNKRVCVLSALADNGSFVKTLENLGADISLKFSYMDHYRYSRNDIDIIIGQCQRNKIDAIVTTQKDWVKIESLLPEELKAEFWYRISNQLPLKIAQELSPKAIFLLILKIRLKVKDEDRFFGRLSSVVSS